MRLLHYSGGDLVLNGNVLDIIDAGGMQRDATYPLFAFFADDGVTPVAHGLSAGALVLGTVPSGYRSFVLDYTSTSNLIQLYVVPEPGTALFLAGLAVAACRRRRVRPPGATA
ncbi:MAG: PEP-CTERM motif protein [Lentisphaerae bacterium ADurb.BinA184]|nr:MAG: PEP-CTERM motif protein [Lentisphaerae bacterium ADurb.BinA184]